MKIRAQLARRGTAGVITLQRAFVAADKDGSGGLDREEFRQFLTDFGLHLSTEEKDLAFDSYAHCAAV